MSKRVDWVYKLIRKWGVEQQILERILEENPGLDPDPVNHVHDLEDRSDKVYLWSLDCTDKQLLELTEKVRSELIRKNGKIKALHLIRNDVTEVKELDPATVREQVKPWLNTQEVEK